jgi:hypothetical protein
MTTTAATSAPAGRTTASWLAMSRGRAFSIHLGLSVFVAVVAAAVVLLAWYPPPYFTALRAWDVARTQLLVFFAAGPLLTLILFKPGKRGLKLDVVVVALLQLTALVHGLAVLQRDRPQFMVFAVDRFFVLTARDLPPEQLAAARAAHGTTKGPALVVATMPSDERERQRLLDETVFQGKPDIERRPELWRPFADERGQVIARQRPLPVLRAAHPQAAVTIDSDESLRGFLPLVVGDRHITVIVDTQTAVPVDVVEADPWID